MDNFDDIVASLESDNNPNAQNPNSSAKGLYQFTDSTAKQYGLDNPMDPVASRGAFHELTSDNKNYLTQTLGREPTDAELYLAHQQGAKGAARLLTNPDARAIDTVGRDAVIHNGGNSSMSNQDFANLWTHKYDLKAGSGLPQGVQVASDDTFMPNLSPASGQPGFISDADMMKLSPDVTKTPGFISDADMDKMLNPVNQKQIQDYSTPSGMASTAIEHAANGAAFGLLPQAEGLLTGAGVGLIQGANAGLSKIGLNPLSQNIQQAISSAPTDPIKAYTQTRDTAQSGLEASMEANPKTALLGEVGGAIGSIPLAGGLGVGSKAAILGKEAAPIAEVTSEGTSIAKAVDPYMLGGYDAAGADLTTAAGRHGTVSATQASAERTAALNAKAQLDAIKEGQLVNVAKSSPITAGGIAGLLTGHTPEGLALGAAVKYAPKITKAVAPALPGVGSVAGVANLGGRTWDFKNEVQKEFDNQKTTAPSNITVDNLPQYLPHLGQYGNVLEEAARRGPDALGAMDFTLQSQDPEYRTLLNQARENIKGNQ